MANFKLQFENLSSAIPSTAGTRRGLHDTVPVRAVEGLADARRPERGRGSDEGLPETLRADRKTL
jgi:hypothetical protein